MSLFTDDLMAKMTMQRAMILLLLAIPAAYIGPVLRYYFSFYHCILLGPTRTRMPNEVAQHFFTTPLWLRRYGCLPHARWPRYADALGLHALFSRYAIGRPIDFSRYYRGVADGRLRWGLRWFTLQGRLKRHLISPQGRFRAVAWYLAAF